MYKFRTYTKDWVASESPAKRRARALTIVARLKTLYPRAKIALKYGNNFQLLVAVVLSAQCTDKKVNEITPALFKKYKTAHDFARARQQDLERMIRPTGFYRNKARNIIAAARKIESDFAGSIPHTMAEALTLPGIARKSANVILGNAYGMVEGIAIDTHVGRLAQRWGLADTDNPVKIEQKLMELVPKKDWFKFTYQTIEHGRAICTAQRRKCQICPMRKLCPSSLV